MRTSDTRTFEAGKLHALPVIAVVEGRVLGRVKDLVFDPSSHRLLGVIVARHRGDRDENFVDVQAIDCLGPYAVTVGREADLCSLARHERAESVVTSGVRFRGAPVLTDAGQPVGRINQIWITPGGVVDHYVVSAGLAGLQRRLELAPADLVVIGEDAAVVRWSALAGRGYHDRAQHLSSLRREAATSADGGDHDG